MNVQKISMRISSDGRREHNLLLPSSLRGLIIGKSNSGKTVLLLNLLLRDGWLDYNNLLVFGNSLHQDEYQIVKRGFERGLGKSQILNLFNNQQSDLISSSSSSPLSPLDAIDAYTGELKGGVTAEFFEDCESIPDPKSLDPKKKNLIILDDCYLGKQSKAGAYYSRGRHNNCDSLYISQNYFSLPRNSVRENSNFIILFPQNNKSVVNIHQDHCTDIPFEEFKNLCRKIWDTKYNFLTLDLTTTGIGKYRENLEKFYVPGGGGGPSGGMGSFIDIIDPTKRNEVVAEYIKTRDMIKTRNDNNKETNLIKEREIEENLQPVVTATKQSANKIVSALTETKKEEEEHKTPYEFYTSTRKNRDFWFSIYQQEDGSFKLGDKNIDIDDDNNIHFDGYPVVPYSTGLWNLIMLNNPKDFTEKELNTYLDLIKITNVITNPRGSRAKNSSKWRFLEKQLGIAEGHGVTDNNNNNNNNNNTTTTVLLPGDINGLKDRLRLLCAERSAGNVRATTAEIVAILDELLRRNYLSTEEYNEVSKGLGC